MYSKITYDYLEGLTGSDCPSNPIKTYAALHNVPIMQPVAIDFLCSQVRIKNPKRILELGTAIGYSGSQMLSACNGHLTTVEKDKQSFEIAKENFKQLNLSSRVTQILGDTAEVVDIIQNKFDFIFLDCAKAQYIHLLNRLVELLEDGGVLVADNVLFRGYVSGEQLAVPRMKTIVKRMREFLSAIKNHDKLQSAIVPVCDGVSVSVKKG